MLVGIEHRLGRKIDALLMCIIYQRLNMLSIRLTTFQQESIPD